MPGDLHESAIPGLLVGELDAAEGARLLRQQLDALEGLTLPRHAAAAPAEVRQQRLHPCLAWVRRLFSRAGAGGRGAE